LFADAQSAFVSLAKLRGMMKKYMPWLFAVAFLFWIGSTIA
jgi:hypothetical protein